MDLDLDAIAKQVADALATSDPESAISFLADLTPAQLTTVRTKVLGLGADAATVEQIFGLLQPGEVINVSGKAPSQITLLGVLVVVGLIGFGVATHQGIKRRRRRQRP